MILVGNQRAGASKLAAHLLNAHDNEHVTVHDVRGFASDTVNGAFNEAYAMSRGTRCKQFLFSLSLNPPAHEKARTDDFEAAIEKAEAELGLTGQPRAIVFHEKEGRRHAHAVWSRIDSDAMKAIPMSHSKRKLMDVSRDLFVQHGWRMPEGMTDPSLRDPKNFTLAEWQQSKRTGHDPRAVKTAFQDAWATSDNAQTFANALQERGFLLARGTRRGYVAIDRNGEPFAVPKYVGIKTKEVRERLGDPKQLPSLEEARAQNATDMGQSFERLADEQAAQERQRQEKLERRKKELVEKQRHEREQAFAAIAEREKRETSERRERFRSGLFGLWDKMRGHQKEIRERNEREALESIRRDRAEKDRLILAQLEQRRQMDEFQKRLDEREHGRRAELTHDAKRSEELPPQPSDASRPGRDDFLDRRHLIAANKPSRSTTNCDDIDLVPSVKLDNS